MVENAIIYLIIVTVVALILGIGAFIDEVILARK